MMKSARDDGPFTLAIDIGGSDLKASVLDRAGTMVDRRVKVATPHPAPPLEVLRLLAALVRPLRAYDRISVGFPGVIKDGRTLTAPNLGTSDWHQFPLAATLAQQLRRPVRVLNDAEVQGLGVIRGRGLECVLTLGTGVGSAVYRHGKLAPHLELGQHPIRDKQTYDEYLGAAALRAKGHKKWNRRVAKAIDIVFALLNYDKLYIGGGNAGHIDFGLPPNVEIVSNEAGITGGVRLWDASLDEWFAPATPHTATARAPNKRLPLRRLPR